MLDLRAKLRLPCSFQGSLEHVDGRAYDRLPTPSKTVASKTENARSMEHWNGGAWRSEPSLREILLLWFVSCCLFVGFISFFRNYFNVVDNFGDGSGYMSLASAIRRWDFRGVVIKQFWGLPYAHGGALATDRGVGPNGDVDH